MKEVNFLMHVYEVIVGWEGSMYQREIMRDPKAILSYRIQADTFCISLIFQNKLLSSTDVLLSKANFDFKISPIGNIWRETENPGSTNTHT